MRIQYFTFDLPAVIGLFEQVDILNVISPPSQRVVTIPSRNRYTERESRRWGVLSWMMVWFGVLVRGGGVKRRDCYGRSGMGWVDMCIEE
jgi:hypothetical protein